MYTRHDIDIKIRPKLQTLMIERSSIIMEQLKVWKLDLSSIEIVVAGGICHDLLLDIPYRDIDVFILGREDIEETGIADVTDEYRNFSVQVKTGDLNIVYKNSEDIRSLYSLVDNFDINSTQCGYTFNLKEQKLEDYINDNFVEYINQEERALKIVNRKTLLRSILRVLDKQNRYSQSYPCKHYIGIECLINNYFELKTIQGNLVLSKGIDGKNIEDCHMLCNLPFVSYISKDNNDNLNIFINENATLNKDVGGSFKASTLAAAVELCKEYDVKSFKIEENSNLISLLEILDLDIYEDHKMIRGFIMYSKVLRYIKYSSISLCRLFRTKLNLDYKGILAHYIHIANSKSLAFCENEFFENHNIFGEIKDVYRKYVELFKKYPWLILIFETGLYHVDAILIYQIVVADIQIKGLPESFDEDFEKLSILDRELSELDIYRLKMIITDPDEETKIAQIGKFIRKWDNYKLYSPAYSKEVLQQVKSQISKAKLLSLLVDNYYDLPEKMEGRIIDKMVIDKVMKNNVYGYRKAAKSINFKVRPGILSNFMYELNGYKVFSYRNQRDYLAALYIGKMTHNCQTLGGVGESCAISSIIDDRTDCLVIEDSLGFPVSVSYVWELNPHTLVCDNIEIKENLPDTIHNEIENVWQEVIKLLPYDNIVVGTGYNDCDGLQGRRTKLDLVAPSSYSDTDKVIVVKELKPGEFDQVKITSKVETFNVYLFTNINIDDDDDYDDGTIGGYGDYDYDYDENDNEPIELGDIGGDDNEPLEY